MKTIEFYEIVFGYLNLIVRVKTDISERRTFCTEQVYRLRKRYFLCEVCVLLYNSKHDLCIYDVC